MKIAICDDDKVFVKQLAEYIGKVEENHQLWSVVYEFTDGEDLYEYYKKHTDIDIIFIDILMNTSNGIEIAKKIRVLSSKTKIIFISAYEQFAREGYGIHADGFLVKPLEYNEVEEKICKIAEMVENNHNSFYFESTNRSKVLLDFDEILYIETYNRQTKIHTKEETFLTNKKMKDFDKILENADFFRCHSSYIVNLQYIKKVEGFTIELKNKTEIPISKPRKKEFMSVFTEYVAKMFNV